MSDLTELLEVVIDYRIEAAFKTNKETEFMAGELHAYDKVIDEIKKRIKDDRARPL